jgi:hypothetical protein
MPPATTTVHDLDPLYVLKHDTSQPEVKQLQLPPFTSRMLTFTKVDRFTTFLAEYTFQDKDIVLHFFPSEEVLQSKRARPYWLETFPRVLDPVARESFGAEPPRLEAQYIETAIPSFILAAQAKATPSWWFCAHGFTEVLDPHGLVERFLSSLDRALDAENAM